MASILNFGGSISTFQFACLISTFLLLPKIQAFRKYDSSSLRFGNSGSNSGNSMEELNLSTSTKPLSSRIRKLPPRYSQHYFSPFQPIQSDTKTFVSMPSNAANFFGPQSYWAQMANRLIDNVVDTVGGHYAATKKSSSKKVSSSSSEEKLETFRKALRNENATRLQYQPLSEFKRKESKETTEVGLDVRYPTRKRLQYTDRNILSSSAEIVQPRKYPSTLSPTAAYPPPSTTPSYSPPTEFGVLPSLLLRNPNARSKFYRLDKYANPQYPPGIKRKVFRPLNPLPSDDRDSEFYRTPTTSSEIRRKPISRISSSTYYYQNSNPQSPEERIFKEIKFRSALKQILADFRKQHPSSFLHSNGKARELSRIAQQEGSRSNRRRRPQSRRIVHLPSRYGPEEEGFRRW